MTPSERQRKRRSDPEKRRIDNERMRKWRADNPEKAKASARRSDLKRNYGIAPEDYDALLASQGSACAICSTKEPGGNGGTFHVDHCHSGGNVRGLLCQRCNMALGLFKDDTAAIAKAVEYLNDRANRSSDSNAKAAA
jgi:Recombination endonuclease VII